MLPPRKRHTSTSLAAAWLLCTATWLLPGSRALAADADGAYGRLEGDLGVSLELGVSEVFGGEALSGDKLAGESLALRATASYLHTVGLTAQYNDALGSEVVPLARTFVGGIELRPLFLGRFAQDLERGPAHLDLFVDSLALGLGVYGSWWRGALCGQGGSCSDQGLELALGVELPLLAQASSPFVALRGGVRWALSDSYGAAAPIDRPLTTGILTLALGYRHILSAHLVDAVDTLPE